MPVPLYRHHDPASHARYQELKQLARSQTRVLAGTPGMLKQRTVAGKQYWMREYIRVDGKKTDEYVGAANAVNEARIRELRAEIELGRTLAAGSASLRLFGYQRIDRKPAAVLAVFYNHRLFGSGLVLVGSHAYGALLNELAVAAAGYRTQDIDVARAQPLAVALGHEADFTSLLKETGMPFVPVPGMPSDRPSGSFKLPGAENLGVDLLIAGERTGDIVAVKELGAHAQSIAYLGFLLDDSIDAIVLSPNQVIPVRVPAPERFALHKLYASQSRRSDRDKIGKDLLQAAVLGARVEEETPGRLGEVFRSMPRAAKERTKRAAGAAAKLAERAHPEGFHALLKIAGGRR